MLCRFAFDTCDDSSWLSGVVSSSRKSSDRFFFLSSFHSTMQVNTQLTRHPNQTNRRFSLSYLNVLLFNIPLLLRSILFDVSCLQSNFALETIGMNYVKDRERERKKAQNRNDKEENNAVDVDVDVVERRKNVHIVFSCVFKLKVNKIIQQQQQQQHCCCAPWSFQHGS